MAKNTNSKNKSENSYGKNDYESVSKQCKDGQNKTSDKTSDKSANKASNCYR